MKTNYFIKMSLLVVAIVGLTFSPVFLHAQALFSVKQNGFSQEKVAQLTAQIEKSDVSTLSLTKNNESKDVYLMTLSSVENSKLIILNEQTGANVTITPVNQSITEFQLTPFFIEEMKQSVLGVADSYLVMETTSDYSVNSTVSVSASNGEVMIPHYFYGAKENVKEALPKDRQIIGIFKAKPKLIPAFPDDAELMRRIAEKEEAMSYYVYKFKLPDGTLCTYDEHFNGDGKQTQNSASRGPLQFALTGQMTSTERTATEYALSLWSKELAGVVPIDIKVDLIDMGDPYILGCSYDRPFFFNPQTKTWYPITLWNQLVGYNASSLNHIKIEMNSGFSWYLGTDGNPSYSQCDYVTTMLHEVNHGLGFADNLFYNDGYPQYNGHFYWYSEDMEYIYIGEEGDDDDPNAFCRQLFQGLSGPCITELTASQRVALVTSGNLYAGRPGSKLLEANGGSRVKMYAPNPYQPGSSISHWDDYSPFSTFMEHATDGSAYHTIGSREIGMLLDMGWTVNGGSGGDCAGVTNMKVDFNANCDAQITWNAPTKAITDTFFEDVESHTNFTINSTVNGWSYIDGDGSSTYGFQDVTFPNSGSKMAYIVFNPSATTPPMSGDAINPHSGSKYFASFAATDAANNDWLISPQLTDPTHLSFWAKSYTDQYGKERMKVGYSTSGTSQSDFTILTSGSYVEVPTVWTKYDYDLPTGTKYIAIVCVSDDAFIFMLDDISIEQGSGPPPPPGAKYNVYRDGSKIASNITTTSYTDTGIDPTRTYTWSVKVVCDSGGESDPANVSKSCRSTAIDENETSTFSVYPNPTTGELHIGYAMCDNEMCDIEIYDVMGRRVATVNTHPCADTEHSRSINVEFLPTGMYFIKIGEKTAKFVKQ